MAASRVEPVSPGMPRGCEQQVLVHMSKRCQLKGAEGVVEDGRTWESNLLGGALLQQQSVLRVEEKDGESAVQQSLVNVLHQVADFLAGTSNWHVILIENDADLVHEADLLFIIAIEVVVLGCRGLGGERGVDLGEEAQDVVGGDGERVRGGGGGGSGGSTHCVMARRNTEAVVEMQE